MLAVYKKELKQYFTSMLGFVFIAFFLIIVGLYFMIYCLMNQMANFSYVMSGIQFLFVLSVPILTMKIIADENRQKTDQLLYTAPVSISKIIVGKYLALVSMFGIAVLIVCFYPLLLSTFGTVDFAIAYGSILGFFLMGSAYIAIGLFISSLTESQVIAAVVSFAVMIFTYLMTSLASLLPSDYLSVFYMCAALVIIACLILHQMHHNGWLTLMLAILCEGGLIALFFIKEEIFDGLIVKILGTISVTERYSNFQLGIFDISALIYYISISFIFVFITIQKIKKKRWS